MGTLYKAVVDCSRQPTLAPELEDDLRRQVTELVAAGRMDDALSLARQVMNPSVTREPVMVPLTDEEMAQRELDMEADKVLQAQERRARRNGLLASSDWTQLPDVPPDTRRAWAEYRQALRDLDHAREDVSWPEPPQ